MVKAKKKILKVDHKKGLVELNLSNIFYSSNALDTAIEDFSEVCKFAITKKDNIKIIITPRDMADLETIGYEFCNYALSLMKNKALV